jgi:signal transduction histidine kinase
MKMENRTLWTLLGIGVGYLVGRALGETEEEKQEYLDIIISESLRLSDLSTKILTLSKYENIEIVTDKVPFRLDEQIRRTILLLEPKWSEKEITMNIEMDEYMYTGNDDLIQQIWLNLLDNAIKFTDHAGLINVSLAGTSEGVQFKIEDDGPGIVEQTIGHIFDKFFQGDVSHTVVGNGLGLALVKRIVELCGGTIEVQSELGTGSAFTVILQNQQ